MEATKIMALKFKLKSKDEVPAELVNLYVERDGAWHLDVEGAVDKAKLEEFRATNVTLMKERDELKQRFEGIDPDEGRKLEDEKRKLEEAQQLKVGEVENSGSLATHHTLPDFADGGCAAKRQQCKVGERRDEHEHSGQKYQAVLLEGAGGQQGG